MLMIANSYGSLLEAEPLKYVLADSLQPESMPKACSETTLTFASRSAISSEDMLLWYRMISHSFFPVALNLSGSEYIALAYINTHFSCRLDSFSSCNKTYSPYPLSRSTHVIIKPKNYLVLK